MMNLVQKRLICSMKLFLCKSIKVFMYSSVENGTNTVNCCRQLVCFRPVLERSKKLEVSLIIISKHFLVSNFASAYLLDCYIASEVKALLVLYIDV